MHDSFAFDAAAARSAFLLDPDFLTVNHGSYGAAPRVVLDAQAEWRRRLETQPTWFMQRILPEALRRAAAALGEFVGARGEDIAFVDNATTGCNAVLLSLDFAAGDEILMLNHGYGAVRNTVRHVAARTGAVLVEAALPFPDPDEQGIVAAVGARVGPRTRLVILDHITSPSALILPLEKLIAHCREAGVKVLVDGAHGPGQVPLDLDGLGADWYVGNCHKWLMAPKGCAFLWTRPDRQRDLHPVVISHGYGKGYLAEFDWTGTRDPSPCLAVDAAIAFHRALGGPKLMDRNNRLAHDGARLLVDRLGTRCGAGPAFHGSMQIVQLPLDGPGTPERALALRARLLDEFRCDAPLHCLAGNVWLRLSAQAYNTIDDYERLAEVAARLSRAGN